MGLLDAIARVNAKHPWSHNDAYIGFVLRHARAVRRRGGDTAVDVGCGMGNLLGHLAALFPVVFGIEPDARTAAAAAERFSASAGVVVQQRPFGAEAAERYDFIVFVASLHHMPLESALATARLALRPGGRLVVVGVAEETPSDAWRSWISLLLNPVLGLALHPRRAEQLPAHMRAPTAAPRESFDDIRAIAADMLPGVRMRRRLFWRYTAAWEKPADA
jgi:SAM-dependent methyltransferase